MKTLIVSLTLFLGLLNIAYAEGQTKVVCVDKIGKDGKVVKDSTGKVQQVCKEIKVHKKLDGTKVPDKR